MSWRERARRHERKTLVPSSLGIKWAELAFSMKMKKTEPSRKDSTLVCEEEASDEATTCEYRVREHVAAAPVLTHLA